MAATWTQRIKTMKINGNTLKQIDLFADAGVTAFDVAARRIASSDRDIMQERKNIPADMLFEKYLKWLKHENANSSEIQIRPHRYDSSCLLFFDDVETSFAISISKKYSSCVIQTSEVGGCHVWLQTDTALNERQRYLAQRYLQPLVRSDKGSISGEHYGRLAGFVNHKRSSHSKRVWVNVIAVSHVGSWHVTDEALKEIPKPRIITRSPFNNARLKVPKNIINEGAATSESESEWGYICGRLEHGADPAELVDELEKRARARGKNSPHRYAETTVSKALAHLSR